MEATGLGRLPRPAVTFLAVPTYVTRPLCARDSSGRHVRATLFHFGHPWEVEYSLTRERWSC
jgi:hypothetical protein